MLNDRIPEQSVPRSARVEHHGPWMLVTALAIESDQLRLEVLTVSSRFVSRSSETRDGPQDRRSARTTHAQTRVLGGIDVRKVLLSSLVATLSFIAGRDAPYRCLPVTVRTCGGR